VGQRKADDEAYSTQHQQGNQDDFLRQRHIPTPVPPETMADILYQYITFLSFFKIFLCI
jgi:hypothetical protein